MFAVSLRIGLRHLARLPFRDYVFVYEASVEDSHWADDLEKLSCYHESILEEMQAVCASATEVDGVQRGKVNAFAGGEETVFVRVMDHGSTATVSLCDEDF